MGQMLNHVVIVGHRGSMDWLYWGRVVKWNGFSRKEAKSNGYNGLEMVIKVVLVGQSLNGLV